MFRFLKNSFIPSENNNYEPHVLRAWPIAVVIGFSVLSFGAAQFLERELSKPDGFLAAVVASVLVDLTNIDRAGEGLHSLTVNSTLVEAAQLKANDMAAKGYFAHNSPDGKTPWYWLGEAGYSFSYAGENLAVFFGDSEDVSRAWMNSPSHRANILNSHFTEIGIATAEGVYQGRQTVFVVQMFGTPSALPPIATLESNFVSENPTQEVEGEVGGETAVTITEENSGPIERIDTIYQDDAFIAVKSGDVMQMPETALRVTPESTAVERLLASPQTLLSYTYALFGALLVFALVLLIFLEAKVQRPKSILFALLALAIVWGLFAISQSDVVVASSETAFTSLLEVFI